MAIVSTESAAGFSAEHEAFEQAATLPATHTRSRSNQDVQIRSVQYGQRHRLRPQGIRPDLWTHLFTSSAGRVPQASVSPTQIAPNSEHDHPEVFVDQAGVDHHPKTFYLGGEPVPGHPSHWPSLAAGAARQREPEESGPAGGSLEAPTGVSIERRPRRGRANRIRRIPVTDTSTREPGTSPQSTSVVPRRPLRDQGTTEPVSRPALVEAQSRTEHEPWEDHFEPTGELPELQIHALDCPRPRVRLPTPRLPIGSPGNGSPQPATAPPRTIASLTQLAKDSSLLLELIAQRPAELSDGHWDLLTSAAAGVSTVLARLLQPENQASGALSTESACAICRARSAVFIPCKHLAVCVWCTFSVTSDRGKGQLIRCVGVLQSHGGEGVPCRDCAAAVFYM